MLKARGVKVLDIFNNETTVFNFICQAGRFIGCTETAVRKVLKNMEEKGVARLIKKFGKIYR